MKKIQLISFYTLLFINLNAQGLKVKRTKVVQTFVQNMFNDTLDYNIIKRDLYFKPKTNRIDSFYIVLINQKREDFKYLVGNKKVRDIIILPYADIEKNKKEPFNTKKNKDMYVVKLDSRLLFYVLFNKDKIWSFQYLKKGRNDFAYFITF